MGCALRRGNRHFEFIQTEALHVPARRLKLKPPTSLPPSNPQRLASKGMSISRPSGEVGKCRMIRHERDKRNEPNPQRFDRIAHTRQTMYKDGINYLSYKLVSKETLALYTKITVDIGKP